MKLRCAKTFADLVRKPVLPIYMPTFLNERIPIPRIASEYRHVYIPQSDVYLGIETEHFKFGSRYDEWIVNDFTWIKDEPNNTWHAIGITHPKPPVFIDSFHISGDGNIHEAENQLFHATFSGTLRELLESGVMTEEDKILYPQQRPGERPECWAPCVLKKNKSYYLFYAPEFMRYATSKDLYVWESKGSLFQGSPMMRDPFVFFEDGVYTIVYVADHLYYRTSTDLLSWSEEEIFQPNPFPAGFQESPYVFKRNGIYYLLWCIYDGQNGCYDNRTYVFAADSLYEFADKAPLTMLPGHATEILEEDGEYYIASVFYPNNGLNLAKIAWND